MQPVNALAKKSQPTPNIQISSLGLMFYRLNRWLASPRPYLMVLGLSLFIFAWYLFTEVLKLPRFEKVPGPAVAAKEWFSRIRPTGYPFSSPSITSIF